MSNPRTDKRLFSIAAAGLVACGLAFADDPNKPRLGEGPGFGDMDPAQEMTLLFGRVERRLRDGCTPIWSRMGEIRP